MLFIDIGNSSIKIKTLEKGTWANVYSCKTNEAEKAAGFLKRSGKPASGISVVKAAAEHISTETGEQVKWLTVNELPKGTLDYQTPETLGIDRYMACLGARSQASGSVIVVDAGTACTIDYMDDKGVYRGGVIMPGLSLWESALKTHAPSLPQVTRDIPLKWPGKTTEDCVRWGISGGFVEAVNGLVRKYDYLASVWVTGGDGDWLYKRMERTAKVDDNLIFKGMNRLMELRLWFS